MKYTNILTAVQQYADEPEVTFHVYDKTTGGRHRTYFIKKKVPHSTLIAILNPQELGKYDEVELNYLPNNRWKVATLEDVLDVENEVNFSFDQVQFSYKEVKEFFENHEEELNDLIATLLDKIDIREKYIRPFPRLPGFLKTIIIGYQIAKLDHDRGNITKEDYEKLKELEKKVELLKRYVMILQGVSSKMNSRILSDLNSGLYNIELEKYKSEKKPDFDFLLKSLDNTQNFLLREEISRTILELITDDNNRIKPEYMGKISKSWALISYIDKSNARWVLPSNVKNESIDVSKAYIVKATFRDTVNAKRIGNISQGKKILLINRMFGTDKNIAIAGDKKLKNQIKENGGKLKKFGNTLAFGEGSVYSHLAEIEKINALSCLNPEKVIEIAKSKGVKTKELEKLVPLAENSFLESRKLADSCVELIYHIDPVAAKRLIKTFRL